MNCDTNEEWEVDQVLEAWLRHGRLQYKLSWKGDPDDAWYPASNVRHAPQRVKDFHDRYPGKPGPPRRLDEWIRAALEDEEDDYAPEHADDDLLPDIQPSEIVQESLLAGCVGMIETSSLWNIWFKNTHISAFRQACLSHHS